MSALCKNCRHEASQHTPQVVYDGPPELLKCKRCVACYPTTMSDATPRQITLRTGQYQITAEDQGYFIRLLQTERDGDDSDLILLSIDDIDELHEFAHATMRIPETMRIEKQCGYCGYRSTWANWVWVDGEGQCPKCGKPDWTA